MDAHARIAELQQAILDRDDQIHQLRLEIQGAVEAVQAAQQAANVPRIHHQQVEPAVNRTEAIIKSLQTPQIIRDIASFDGNPVKLHSFVKCIDNLIPLLDGARDTPIFPVWMQAIRSKIIGDADTVLEIYGTSTDWEEIKNTLITHYSDKRDEISLTRDLFKLNQNTTVEDFYSRVSHAISLLVNLLNLNEDNADVKLAKNSFYQELGLKVFLAGLKDPLGPIIRAQSPKTLKEALRLCLEEGNFNYVKNPFRPAPQIPPRPTHSVPNLFQQHPRPMQPPPRPFQPIPRAFQPQPRAFQPRPGPFQPHPRPYHSNSFNQFRPNFPNPHRNVFAQGNNGPQPRPTPMEVDPSIRTRQVNYMNRPNFQVPEEFIPENYYWNYNYYYTCSDFENQNNVDVNAETHDSNAQQSEADDNQGEIANQIDDLNFRQPEAELPPT